MKRKPLYSRASRRRSGSSIRDEGAPVAWSFEENQGSSLAVEIWRKSKAFVARHDRSVPAAAAVLIAVGLFGAWQWFHPGPTALTQWDIDNAVKYTLSNTPPGPAETTVAAATVGPSVVRVDGFLSPEHAAQQAKLEAAEAKKNHLKIQPMPPPKSSDGKDADKDKAKDESPDSTGTGVVIDDKGDILTNLHVIHSTDRWVVTFFDGSKSEATVVNVQPENDLAVIRTKTQPDDLKPATLASTANLFPGDTVVAVGRRLLPVLNVCRQPAADSLPRGAAIGCRRRGHSRTAEADVPCRTDEAIEYFDIRVVAGAVNIDDDRSGEDLVGLGGRERAVEPDGRCCTHRVTKARERTSRLQMCT